MKNFYLVLLAIIGYSFLSFGQSEQDVKKIISNYDIAKLNKMEAF